MLKKTWRVSVSIGVRITMIRCVVYLLRIFKMFHGLMNNLVLKAYFRHVSTKMYLLGAKNASFKTNCPL